MGAVYRKVWGFNVPHRKKRMGKNWHRLHKTGHAPKHKDKHRAKVKAMEEEIKEL